MEYLTMLLVFLPIMFTLLHFFNSSSKSTNSKLPPGPKPLPIIGNLHQLSGMPHHSITKLSETYGPLMYLKLGSADIVVLSSPEMAKEMYLKHDLAFSGRPFMDAIRGGGHEKSSVLFLSVGPKWRHLRKIAAVQFFTNQRLDATQALRRKKVDELVEFVRDCCKTSQAINIREAASTTSHNLLSNMFFSINFANYDPSKSLPFKHISEELQFECGRPNVSDLFPKLKYLDLQGINRRSTGYIHKIMAFFQEVIDERLKEGIGSKDDVLDTMLKLHKEDQLSLQEVKNFLLDLMNAGTDTTAKAFEWAMTELLRQPELIAKAQSELDKVLGKDHVVQESDISNLPYIQAIVKETLRMHPPVPFLLPHRTEEDVLDFCGYFVPKDAIVWVNMWGIGRNPNLWSNPNEFYPDRFLEGEADKKGREFDFIPFGAGRRICPGMPLAYRMLHLMVASLLHSFNWKLADNMDPKDIDMGEDFGVTLRKSKPLLLVPIAR